MTYLSDGDQEGEKAAGCELEITTSALSFNIWFAKLSYLTEYQDHAQRLAINKSPHAHSTESWHNFGQTAGILCSIIST